MPNKENKRYILSKEFDNAMTRVGKKPYHEIQKGLEKLADSTLVWYNDTKLKNKEGESERIIMKNNNNVNTKKFKVDRFMMIFSFRYALGRMSSAPSIVIDNYKSNIKELTDIDIELNIKEIKEQINYGMDMDKNTWLNFADYLESELKLREIIKRKDDD